MPWYVGQTKAGLGPWAEKNLLAQPDIVDEVYVPRILGPDGKTGENLFSRYLFVHCEENSRHHSTINSTRGMNRLLPLRVETPLSVRNGYVEDLIARVGKMGTLDKAEEVTYDYATDEQIRIVNGPWAGKVAPFQYRKKGLAVLLLVVLGRPRLVPVPLSYTSSAKNNDCHGHNQLLVETC